MLFTVFCNSMCMSVYNDDGAKERVNVVIMSTVHRYWISGVSTIGKSTPDGHLGWIIISLCIWMQVKTTLLWRHMLRLIGNTIQGLVQIKTTRILSILPVFKRLRLDIDIACVNHLTTWPVKLQKHGILWGNCSTCHTSTCSGQTRSVFVCCSLYSVFWTYHHHFHHCAACHKHLKGWFVGKYYYSP